MVHSPQALNSRRSVCSLLVCLTQAGVIWGKGTTVEKTPSLVCGPDCGTFLVFLFLFGLMVYMRGTSPLWAVPPWSGCAGWSKI